MNYDFNEQEQAFFKELATVLQPYAAADAGRPAAPPAERMRSALAALSRTAYLHLELDAAAAPWSQTVTWMAAVELFSALAPSLALAVETSTRIFGRLLRVYGDEAQRRRWLTPVIEGRRVGAVALCEHTVNIENDPLQTEGVRQGGSVVVSGTKQYVVNAPLADCFAVAGRMDDGLAVFLVSADSNGLEVGEPYRLVGFEETAVSSLKLEACRLPEDHVIGPFEGSEVLERLRLWENAVMVGLSLGLMKAAFEAAKSHARSHHSGGRPIIAYQAVGFKLAEMLTRYQTAQLLAYRTAWTLGEQPRQAPVLIWCAKAFCSEAAEKIASDALQILGGQGYHSGNAVERAYRCAKYAQIAGTSSEIIRLRIGDDALGLR
jgi:alkylation response protein AidB-like acyl-CoA dehydrogenase